MDGLTNYDLAVMAHVLIRRCPLCGEAHDMNRGFAIIASPNEAVDLSVWPRGIGRWALCYRAHLLTIWDDDEGVTLEPMCPVVIKILLSNSVVLDRLRHGLLMQRWHQPGFKTVALGKRIERAGRKRKRRGL